MGLSWFFAALGLGALWAGETTGAFLALVTILVLDLLEVFDR